MRCEFWNDAPGPDWINKSFPSLSSLLLLVISFDFNHHRFWKVWEKTVLWSLSIISNNNKKKKQMVLGSCWLLSAQIFRNNDNVTSYLMWIRNNNIQKMDDAPHSQLNMIIIVGQDCCSVLELKMGEKASLNVINFN